MPHGHSICGNDRDGYCCFEDAQKATASSCVCSPGKAFMIKAGHAVTTIAPSPSGPAVSNAASGPVTSSATSRISSTTSSDSSTVSPPRAATSSAVPQKDNKSVKLGVGIGVPIGVALLAGLGFLLWRQRRHREQIENSYRLAEVPDRGQKVHEMEGVHGYKELHELPGSRKADARGYETLHELPGARS
ncbi:MAG: hypothetical protein M1830_006844 [Pleopsidium flavum]|nr:MAG: hypothetical protein M1830_006844 [Pleopsidium flavum]